MMSSSSSTPTSIGYRSPKIGQHDQESPKTWSRDNNYIIIYGLYLWAFHVYARFICLLSLPYESVHLQIVFICLCFICKVSQ
jgi:hypothetical protein